MAKVGRPCVQWHEQGGAERLFLSLLAPWLLAEEKWMWVGEHVWARRGFERALARVSERSHCQSLFAFANGRAVSMGVSGGWCTWSGMQKLEVVFCLLEKRVKGSDMKVLLLFTVQGHGFTEADCCSGAC